jgi:hypothetical protein
MTKELSRTEMLDYNNSLFGWPIDHYEIGDFFITKHINKNDKSYETVYCCFVNNKPTSDYAYTLDDAIVVCLAHKYDGPHSPAIKYARRVLGMPVTE